MKQFLLSILLFILFSAVQAQTDTAFWFAAPEVTFNGGAAHSDRPIFLRITTLSTPATVTVSEPANSNFTTKQITIPANSSYTFNLTSDIDQIESKPPNAALNYGLYIHSTSNITAYYEESSQNNPEMFVLKGSNALGTAFFVPTQNLMDNDSTKIPAAYSSFDIVATEDNTVVTITPAKDIVGHKAGITFTINLNKGQIYSAAAVAYLAAGHLSGSVVTSNKPIAITIKDDSIGGGGYYACLDLAGDQIVPISIIGTQYISIPGYLNNSPLVNPPTDWVFIVATQNNTTVTINNVLETTLNAGQTYQRGVHDSTLYINASAPIYTLHLSGFSCEVGHALLPPIECTGSTTVGFTRSLSIPLFMNILVPVGGESGFTFNGSSTVITASMFSPVLYSGGQWMYARIPVSVSDLSAGSAAIVSNSIQQFHLGIIHGDLNGCRYGYFSDFNHFTQKLSTSVPNNTLCENNTIQLISDVGNAKFINYQWNGPNGFNSNSKSPLLNSVSVNNSGKYYCSASKSNCTTLTDSILLIVNPVPKTKISVPNPVCTGTLTTFKSVNTVAGLVDAWLDPKNNTVSTNTTYSKNNIQLSDSGRYILNETLAGCAASDTVHLKVDTTPVANILPVITPCQNQHLALNSSPSNVGSLYTWKGPNGFNSGNLNDTIHNYNIADTGLYTFTVLLGNCSSTASVHVSIRPIPVIQFNPLNTVCQNAVLFNIPAIETSGIAGVGAFTGNGIVDITAGLFSPKVAGSGNSMIQYSYTATNGCKAFQQQTIAVKPAPFISTIPSQSIFSGNSTILQTKISGSYNAIQWSPSLTLSDATLPSPVATPTTTTTYVINVFNNDGCTATDTAIVNVLLNIKIPNAFTPNGDGKHDSWEIKDLDGVNNVIAYVFDRNGQKVYTSTGNKIAWDGKYNGQPVPEGTYYYIVTLNDEQRKQTLSGWIYLLK